MTTGLWLLIAANLGCLALVALVPLSLWLGLAEVDIPVSAIVGFAMVALPALLSVLALWGTAHPRSRLARPLLRQLALLADTALAVVAAVSLYHMLADGRADLAPFAFGMLLLFATDAVVLLRAPGPADDKPGDDTR